MKDYTRLKKSELIAEIKQLKENVTQNTINNSNITVHSELNEEDTQVMLNVSKALENITEAIKNRRNQSVYGVYFGKPEE